MRASLGQFYFLLIASVSFASFLGALAFFTMNLDDEHTSFHSTIAFPPPSPNGSELTLVAPEGRQSISTLSPSVIGKSICFRSSTDSNPKSGQTKTHYGLIGQSTQYPKYWFDTWIIDYWFVELGALVLALFFTGALIVILLVDQNKAMPHWRWGLTLNSLLSILSQVAT